MYGVMKMELEIGKIILILALYFAAKYIFFITLIAKGYEKSFMEVILSFLSLVWIPMLFRNPWIALAVIETELIVSNILFVLNVVLLKRISFRILASVAQNRFESKLLCKIFNKKKLCRKLREILRIEYGPKLKQGLPSMAGKTDKKTKVKFDQMGFPKFKSFYDVKLKRKDYKNTREAHFYYANKKIYKKAQKNKKVRKLFTRNEMNELKSGQTPARYTWHHHQNKGKLQLVSRKIHSEVNHIGGYKIWGGEAE